MRCIRSALVAGLLIIAPWFGVRADTVVSTDQVTTGGAGGGATSLITQMGSTNYGTIDQSGGYVSLLQQGNANHAAITSVGSSITATQIGSGLGVTISGNGPSVTVTQSKPGH